MTEAAVGENRNRPKRKILIPRRHVTRARHLGKIELAAAQEPPVPRRRSHIGQHRELDPFRAHDAFRSDPAPPRNPSPTPRQDRTRGRAGTASAAATEPYRSAP